MFQTDSNVTYFEKHYRENLNPDNYTDYMGNGTIYYGGAGCGKTYKLCQLASEAEDHSSFYHLPTKLPKM